jgi:hypothetical protein
MTWTQEDRLLPRSLPEFQKLFPTDAACAAYLERIRWDDGFACPHCGTQAEPYRFAADYLPIIHLVFSNLKAWLKGVHHGVSPQHLQAYLNEFTFRFNRRYRTRR